MDQTNLELWPEQLQAYNKICDIISWSHVFANNTPTGGGKTEMCIKLSLDYGLDIILVTERNIINQWRSRCNRYGVNFIGITYAALRGSSNYKPDFRFLNAVGDGYVVSDYFHKMASSGVLLIFDEYHRLKNNTSQHYAACELIHCVVENDYPSRVGLLSASPSAHLKDAYRLIKLLGITNKRHATEYVPSTGHILKGLADVIDKAILLAPDYQIDIGNINSNEAEQICERLYNDIFKQHYCVAAKKRLPATGTDIKNQLCHVSGDTVAITKAIDMLSKCIDITGKIVDRSIDVASRQLQHYKIHPCVEEARQVLDMIPNSKVLVIMFYVDDLNRTKQALQNYGCEILYGQTKNSSIIIDKFQEDNNDIRVLVCQVNVTCVGLNLDDVHGGRPRFMYIIPNYNFINLYQAKDRIYRGTTKSLATVRFIYFKGYESEIQIMSRLLERKQQLERYIPEGVPTWFPGKSDLV